MPQQTVRVGVRVVSVGNKSICFKQQIESEDGREVMARADFVSVAYDYAKGQSRRVPDKVRQVISHFEGGR
jgi:acyl-CoA thioesterase FadM